MLDYKGLKDLIVSLDPSLTEHIGDSSAESYTIVTPIRVTSLMSDDKPEDQVMTVQIERYSNRADDQLIDWLEDLLDFNEVQVTDPVGPYYDAEMERFRTILTAYVLRKKGTQYGN